MSEVAAAQSHELSFGGRKVQLLLFHSAEERVDETEVRIEVTTMDQGVVQEDRGVASQDVAARGGLLGEVRVNAGH